MARSEAEKARDRILGFGWDENFLTNAIVLDKTKDVKHIGGILNLDNAIVRRLKTPLGFYPEYPYYGSRLFEMVGMGNTGENRALIETWVEESLMYENRIRDRSIEVKVDPYPGDHRAVFIKARAK